MPRFPSLKVTNRHLYERVVAVDLTPVQPGGANGGAKSAALALLKRMSELRPQWRFFLLTNSRAHDELSTLDGTNVERCCVLELSQHQQPSSPKHSSLKRALKRVLPTSSIKVGKRLLEKLRRLNITAPSGPTGGVTTGEIPGLLFSPFGNLEYYDPRVATVAVIHDIQYAEYPAFFTEAELAERDAMVRAAYRHADRIICDASYVKTTLMHHSGLPAERFTVIPIAIGERLVPSGSPLHRMSGRRYLIYPANTWPHKNHGMLLTAFARHCRLNPEDDLHLALTGAEPNGPGDLERAITCFQLCNRVHLLGFLPEAELGPIMADAVGMIFPSFYEGFGIPVIEAMTLGIPVACSDATVLPEVAGDAALLFDPRRPGAIAEAIHRLSNDAALRAELVRRGHARVTALGSTTNMAEHYLAVFSDALSGRTIVADAMTGCTADGWTSDRLLVAHTASPGPRELHLTLILPAFSPHPRVTLTDNCRTILMTLAPGEQSTVRIPIQAASGVCVLHISNTFRPCDIGLGTDARQLGLQCVQAFLSGPDATINLR
jgi:glycosyltransferase involved in cell wall biosynthesis